MKKHTLFSIIFIAVLMVFTMVFAQAGFAEITITIDNKSNTALKPVKNQHRVGYVSTTSPATCLPNVPADACGMADLTPPSEIAKNSTAVIKMSGPKGCDLSMWQTYYKPDVKGNPGQIQCSKSPINKCNNSSLNYTCTISQANVDSAKGGGDVSVSVP
ncbi:MAG: hypothetical protein WAW61_20640 [Methylococcaceae bacterium]